MSDDNFEWVPAILATFLAITMTAIIIIVSIIPRKKVVSQLNVYPIKSCGPMGVNSAQVTARGFSYDRFAQVSDSDGNYLTPRDKANVRLFLVRPTIVNHEQSSGTHLHLTCSDAFGSDQQTAPFMIQNLNKVIKKSTTKEVTPMIGPKVKVKDLGDDVAKWLSKITKIEDCRLTVIGPEYDRSVEMNPDQGEAIPLLLEERKKDTIPPVSLADEAPFLLTTASSLKDLNARLAVRGKLKVGMQRFRPNIVVYGTKPWEEDTWKRIKIGGSEFRVWQRCGRCSMTTIDRDTLERGPEPLATLSTFRERSNGMRNFGMHMIPIMTSPTTEASPSMVTVGDTLEILEYDEERLDEWKRLFDH